jgi:hypothetical protein
MPITADRGGITSNQWYQTGIPVNPEQGGEILRLRFNLDSKGGGQTETVVNIDASSFGIILALMLKCNFDMTIKTFAKEIIRFNRLKNKL